MPHELIFFFFYGIAREAGLRVVRETCMDEAQRKAGEDNHGECTLGI
jgi:hypothetical protein